MHNIPKLAVAFLALALAPSALAKKANYRIELYRYNLETTGCGLPSDRVGHKQDLHNNKCKSFDADEPPFGRFMYEWNGFTWNGP